MAPESPYPPLWRRALGPYLGRLFQIALGVIFVVAALPKIDAPQEFALSIAHYRLLPDTAINALAITLPWVELICGLALVLGIASRANLLVVAMLLMVFIVAIGQAMVRGLDISCGCFSAATASTERMTRWTLYWDVIWLVMTAHALVFERGLLSLTTLLCRGQRRPERQG